MATFLKIYFCYVPPYIVIYLLLKSSRTEVTRLEKQTANEREKYQRSTRSLQAVLSTPPLLDVQYEVKNSKDINHIFSKVIIRIELNIHLIFLILSYPELLMTDGKKQGSYQLFR